MEKINEIPADKVVITVETSINAPIEKVWNCWTLPEHITNWNHASDDWHCPAAENDLRPGGKFSYTMAAKDGSFSFDFSGVHTAITLQHNINTILDDGRKMEVTFKEKDGKTKVVESFEAEDINTIELQKGGWQAILDNFKKHTEAS